MKYDIFLSYRRYSSETAGLIAEKLRSAGYRVFFDIESLRGGKFNEQLLGVIEQCRDFIIVLPEGALDRCNDKEDWVRREVLHAISCGKNIIPVMLSGFAWPSPMPEGMEELKNFQAITATSHEYFDLAMQRLCSYLKSSPHRRYRHLLRATTAVIAAAIVLGAVGYLAFRSVAIPVCSDAANTMTLGMGVFNQLGETNKNLGAGWAEYCAGLASARTGNRVENLKKSLSELLEFHTQEVARLRRQQPAPEFEVSDFRTFLLGLYGVDVAELKAFSRQYDMTFDELDGNIAFLKNVVESNDYGRMNLKMADANLKIFQHSLNGFYYAYLEIMSLLPNRSRKLHAQLVSEWGNLPDNAGLNLSREEYVQLQQKELNRIEALIRSQEAVVMREEDRMDKLNDKLDSMAVAISRHIRHIVTTESTSAVAGH